MWLLYLKWDLNLEVLEPNNETLWFNFVLKKANRSHNTIFDTFKNKANKICLMMK